MQSWWKASFRYGNIGLELVLSFFAGLLGGRWLDHRYFGSHGYATAIGAVVGLYAGGRAFYKLVKQAQREAEEEDVRDREEAMRNAKVEAYKREVDTPDPDDERHDA
jgi:hypothetical protein